MRVSLYVNVRKYPEVCVARSLNMHVRVISQNSRRKDIAEDEGSNVLYRMHSTLQFMVRSK
jgi:hypothetical protein